MSRSFFLSLLLVGAATQAHASSVENILSMPVQERTALADYYYSEGKWRKARGEYKILARLGSKYAQQRISEMVLQGRGYRQDPALAWAWAAMSAEVDPARNAEYRQQIWQSLSEEDQARAVDEYEDIYKSYSELAITTRLANQARWRTKFRSISNGLRENQLLISSGCDLAGVGYSGGGGLGRGALTSFGSAECVPSMIPWHQRDNMTMYRMIQYEMERRLRGGTVTLGEFEILEWVPEEERAGPEGSD